MRHRTRQSRPVMRTIIAAAAACGVVFAASGVATAEPRADDDANIVKNSDFALFSGQNPDSWSRWSALGSSTVSKGAGPGDVATAVLTGTSVDTRIALTQDVTLGAERDYMVQFDYKTDDLVPAYNYSRVGIRVDGQGTGALPAVWVEGAYGTNDWQTVTEHVKFAAPTTKARLHLMIDYGQGSFEITNVRMYPTAPLSILSASTTKAGDTLISWTTDLFGDAAVDRVELHRFDDGELIEPGADSLLRSVSATTLRATDHAWIQGVKYTYLAVGLDVAGEPVWQSEPLAYMNSSVDKTKTSYVVASLVDGATHVSWRTPTALSGSLQVSVDGTTVASNLEHIGDLDLAQTASKVELLDHSGEVIATATAASLDHPRIGLTAERLEHARTVIATQETPAEGYAVVKARIDAGLGDYPASGDTWAREAVFAREAALIYQIDADPRYAQIAYEGAVASITKVTIPTPQELEAANVLASLALAYDWCYDAWTEEQRRTLEDYFDLAVLHLQTGQHNNIIFDDKASNWVGVVRGAELAYQLVTREPGEWADARLGQLIDQLDQHQWAAYSQSGMFQEGIDYLDYTAMITGPGVEGSFDQGIDALKESWYAPDIADLVLHAVALTDSPKRLQWGVGTAGNSIVFPLYLERAKEERLAAYIDLWEKRAGHLAGADSGKYYSPGYVTDMFLYWPLEQQTLDEPLVPEALIDTDAGAYLFRNRVADSDDVLVGFNSRNHNHLGWSGYDSFAISLISHNTMWASMPSKSQSNAAGYSRLMVDDKAAQSVGNGTTLASHAYPDQGGGYVQFEAGANIGLNSAQRELVVNMTPAPDETDRVGGADAVIFLSDTLNDTNTHSYSWQLVPEAGVDVEILPGEGGIQKYRMSTDDGWLYGWVLDPGAQLTWNGTTFRITMGGQSNAQLSQIIAVGSGAPAEVTREGRLVTVGNDTYDLDALADFEPYVAPVPPVVVGVEVLGDLIEGESLSATADTDETELTYQWYRSADAEGDGAAIDGATEPTYLLTSDDVDAYVWVAVTGPNLTGTSDRVGPIEAVEEPTIEPVVVGVQVTGGLVEGESLSATADTDETELTYQWYRSAQVASALRATENLSADAVGGIPIPGANDATYRLTADDIGAHVWVVVTGPNLTGISDPVGPIEAADSGKEPGGENGKEPGNGSGKEPGPGEQTGGDPDDVKKPAELPKVGGSVGVALLAALMLGVVGYSVRRFSMKA